MAGLISPGTTRRAFFAALRDSPAARAELQARLAAAPYPAFFWECAPLTADDRPAAYAIVDAPALAGIRPDLAGFARELAARPGRVASFWNLSGDALLVVPRDEGVPYPHLAAFARTAPADVADLFWARVGEEALRWDRGPVWVSTHGLGVAWLHVRLDVRPKYYRTGELRELGRRQLGT
jgi:hypothetical protein